MSRGRRYSEERQLNLKKVYAVIGVIIFIVMFIIGLNKILKEDKNTLATKNVELNYFSLYTNGNWGVINSSGDTIIQPEYGEMILIPNKAKPVFVCTYDVNYVDGTFKTKVINEKKQEIFTGYDNYFVLQNRDSNNTLWFEENSIKVQKDGKYGLLSLDGNLVLPCEYDNISVLNGIKNSLIIKKDGKIGLVNAIGTLIVPVEYTEISAITNDYRDGYIVKDASGKFGVIKSNGQKVFDCNYADIKHIISNNMYVVKEDAIWKVILEDGTSYLDGKVANAVSINSGNVIVKENGKYGVLNIQSNEVIPSEYEEISFMFDNKYIAKKDGKYGVINTNNEVLIEFTYAGMAYNKETDYIKAQNENGTYDYITRDLSVQLNAGDEIIFNGFIGIVKNGDIKYYNYKLEEKSNRDVYVSNTIFVSRSNGKFGFVSKDGKNVINAIYDDATEQNDYGFVAINKDGKWGAIDQQGKVVVEPTYELKDYSKVDFIGKWHLCADSNANYYTDEM